MSSTVIHPFFTKLATRLAMETPIVLNTDGSIIASNQKRIDSCKAVGGEKKRTGHRWEDIFGERFCDQTSTTYKAEADKVITNPELLAQLDATIGTITSGATSIKSGRNLQFTLGCIPEITESEDKLMALSERPIWEKYLGKSHSTSPAHLISYRTETGWVFFNMSDVITFIVTHARWRTLNTGRIKGDFADGSRKGFSQYLTYEYRKTHGSYFLGANGNRGRKFVELLITNLRFLEVEDR